MDQSMRASLSHAHYWYEVCMRKVSKADVRVYDMSSTAKAQKYKIMVTIWDFVISTLLLARNTYVSPAVWSSYLPNVTFDSPPIQYFQHAITTSYQYYIVSVVKERRILIGPW